MIVVGITGQSGSGKTTAAKMFAEKGFYHIDCDFIVHNKVYKNKQLLKKIADNFSDDCVTSDGINRRNLSRAVFSDKKQYRKLMEIIMPFVKEEIMLQIKSRTEPVIVDAPLLFEYGLEKVCSCTVGVVSDNIVERICLRDSISPQEAKRRISSQKTQEFYRQHCDYIIENNSDVQALETCVSKIAETILKGTGS